MKKLIALFLVATVLSCSSEDQVNQDARSTAANSGSVLDGKVLSFKSEESFIKEYAELTTLNSSELKSWVSAKKVTSLLNTLDNSTDIEGDVISGSRLIYSDALKSILNNESKIKVGGKVLWLNERTFYVLSENEINKSSKELFDIKDKLEISGQLLSVSGSAKKSTGRLVLPYENAGKSFASEEVTISGSRLRHVLELYNETIVFNNMIQTSKMFLKSTLQYRSCSSIGGCKWKEAFNSRGPFSNLEGAPEGGYWRVLARNINSSSSIISGSQTFLIGDLTGITNSEFYLPGKFFVSGYVGCSIYDGFAAIGSVPTVNISWY